MTPIVVNAANVRMRNARGEHHFALESIHHLRIRRQRGVQSLQRHLPVQLGIRRLPHLTHAAFAQKALDPEPLRHQVAQSKLTQPRPQPHDIRS